MRRHPGSRSALTAAMLLLGSMSTIACEAGPAPATPPIDAGATDRPREVNIVARDYLFQPEVVDLVPGETVILNVINGGLEIHEAILGDMAVQDAWEAAEAATVGAPPGPTPVVSVAPEVSGLRLVVESGELASVAWTVPVDVADQVWVVGCHIPGHWERGMQVPIRWVDAAATVPSPSP